MPIRCRRRRGRRGSERRKTPTPSLPSTAGILASARHSPRSTASGLAATCGTQKYGRTERQCISLQSRRTSQHVDRLGRHALLVWSYNVLTLSAVFWPSETISIVYVFQPPKYRCTHVVPGTGMQYLVLISDEEHQDSSWHAVQRHGKFRASLFIAKNKGNDHAIGALQCCLGSCTYSFEVCSVFCPRTMVLRTFY